MQTSHIVLQFPTTAVFQVKPVKKGLGKDMIIGGEGRPSFSTIDLSLLDIPVEIDWSDNERGTITDGVDCIVFSGVQQIILPDCMNRP